MNFQQPTRKISDSSFDHFSSPTAESVDTSRSEENSERFDSDFYDLLSQSDPLVENFCVNNELIRSSDDFDKVMTTLVGLSKCSTKMNPREYAREIKSKEHVWNQYLSVLEEEDFQMNVRIGNLNFRGYLYKEILEALNEAEKISQNIRITSRNASTFQMMYDIKADILVQLGEYSKGALYLAKALNIIREFLHDNEDGLAFNQTHRAELYYNTGDFERAERCLRTVLNIRKKQDNNPCMLAFCYMQFMQMYLKCEKLEKAKEYLEKAMDTEKSVPEGEDRTFVLGRLNVNRGQIYYRKGKIEKARKCYLEGMEMIQEVLPEGNFFSELYQHDFKEKFEDKTSIALPNS